MKLNEIAQQWTESSLGGFEIHRIKQRQSSGEGIAYMYSYNDDMDEEVPVRITFDYESGYKGSFYEPPSRGSVVITSIKTQNGQNVPVDSVKYDPADLLEAINEYYNDQRDAAAEDRNDQMRDDRLTGHRS